MSRRGVKGRKKSSSSEFFRKNRLLIILLPVLIIGIAVAVILYLNPGGIISPGTSDFTSNGIVQTGLTGQAVEVLPQMERVTQSEVSLSDVRDPFSLKEAVPVLKGITLSGEKSTAIVETDNRVYVVSVGDLIGNTWTVEEIGEAGVILERNDGKEVYLSFAE